MSDKLCRCVPVEGQPAAARLAWTSSGFAAAAAAAAVVAAVAAAAGGGADKPEWRQTERKQKEEWDDNLGKKKYFEFYTKQTSWMLCTIKNPKYWGRCGKRKLIQKNKYLQTVYLQKFDQGYIIWWYCLYNQALQSGELYLIITKS